MGSIRHGEVMMKVSLVDLRESVFTIEETHLKIIEIQTRLMAGEMFDHYHAWYIRPKKGQWNNAWNMRSKK